MIVTRIVVRISKTLNISGKAKGNHKVISFVVVFVFIRPRRFVNENSLFMDGQISGFNPAV